MVQIVVNADQAKLMLESSDSVELVDEKGRRLGTVVRPPSDEDVRIAKERISKREQGFSTAEVVAHLQSLDQK